jgi:endo-1,4-beta-D-glucanase Y
MLREVTRCATVLALFSFFSGCDSTTEAPEETAGTAGTAGVGASGGTSGAGASGGTGTAGSSGAAGGTTVMKDPSAYAHNSPGARYPYPQGRAFPHCQLPVYNTDHIVTAYNNWKTRFYQNGRVIRPDSQNDGVSEGIAYGMLIGVYMNDKPMFDALWAFAQSKFDSKGLMNWRYDASGNVVGQGSAIDADEDMAWALLMAAVQWGGDYQAQAVTLIGNIWTHGVEQGSNVLKPGDNFGGSSLTNPSYFAPSYYRVFARVGGQNWMGVVDSSYSTLAAASGAYGLVPNWTNAAGQPATSPANDGNGAYYGYDACRTPWRIALDYCTTGDPRAKAYLDKVAAFFASRAPTSVGTLLDGYTADGNDPPGTLGDYSAGMAMFGPATTAALTGTQSAFLALGTSTLHRNTTQPGGQFTYFNASWGVLSLLVLSGNFWEFTP